MTGRPDLLVGLIEPAAPLPRRGRAGKPEDLIVLHFSCHGLKDDSGELYLAATNTQPCPIPGWIGHSRQIVGWGDEPDPIVGWVAHVRGVVGEAT